MNEFTIITVIAGIIISLVALNYNKKTYKKDYIDKPAEELRHLLSIFKATQKTSHEVYNEITNYAIKHCCLDAPFPFNTSATYKQCLKLMKETQISNLSNELYEEIKATTDLPSLTIQSMSKSLDKQLAELMNLRNYFRDIS